MSTHTPGPWKIVQGGDEECIYIEESGHSPNGRGAIATVFTVHEKPTENEQRDACLIAAAPDLLEALRGAIDGSVIGPSPQAVHPSGMFCTVCGVNSREVIHNRACRVGIAEKAIAKAKGAEQGR